MFDMLIGFVVGLVVCSFVPSFPATVQGYVIALKNKITGSSSN